MADPLNIRAFQKSDTNSLLKVFDENTPRYFSPEERQDYAQYLQNEIEDYFIVLKDNNIVGAGGINYLNEEIRISWDLVSKHHHGQGIGRFLTEFRIAHIQVKDQANRPIVVRTTPMVSGFYKKLGFQVENRHKDYWAPGYDMVRMTFRKEDLSRPR